MLTWSADAVADALDKLTSLGAAQPVTGKPRTRRRPGAGAEAEASTA